MTLVRRNLHILNLTGALSQELGDYFASRSIDVSEATEGPDWTHVLVRDLDSYDDVSKTYDLVGKKRHLITLTKPRDLQNFIAHNGNMVLSGSWFKGPMGPFIMDKYFQGYGGITLGENYPTFKEQGSFNIVNPFSTGEYLDRLVQSAFEEGVEALSIKTYFDHLIMYLAGLKNKGKAGYPFEVTYGSFEEIFAVQVHLFSQSLALKDVTASLSTALSKKAEEYFLNVAVQSADFFDFSFMPEVNKIVVTSLWTKDKRITFENRGLMFCSLTTGATVTAHHEAGLPSAVTAIASPLLDFTNKIVIPEGKQLDDSNTRVSGSEESDQGIRNVSGHLDEDDSLVLLEGSDETDDEALLIAGEKELDELIQNVRGKFEKEDTSSVRVGGSGTKLDLDKVAFRIASSVDQSTEENELQVRSLGSTLPERIKTGLFDFAKGLDIAPEDLTDHDLLNFQLQKMPQIIQRSLVKEANAAALANSSFQPTENAGSYNKLLEKRLLVQKGENEKLRKQLRTLATEVKLLKETRKKLSEIQMKAAEAAALESGIPKDDDEELRRHYQIKLLEQKALNEQDQKKLSALLERESKLIADVKQEEIKAKKIHIESIKKESFFSQELDKVERTNKAKDLIILKTKETFTKLMEKKLEEINSLKAKNDQLSKALANGPSSSQTQTIRDLEKQNQNLNKQLEVYKIKVTSLASNMQATKAEENSKDEARKLQMFNQQLKNQLDASKKENEKLFNKMKADEAQLASLRQEKVRLEGILKKATADVKETPVQAAPQMVVNDQELKRLQAQNQLLETHVKESTAKIMGLEAKLADSQKSKGGPKDAEESSKVKLSQMEGSVKKLTQDLVESRNQLAEMKKETNKLRQEKTALQNQVDKMKKEAEKAKPVTPKKGKAA